MKRGIVLAALVGLAIALGPTGAAAQTDTMVTAGAVAAFPSGTTFNGVPISGLRTGIGVTIAAAGTAVGTFQTTLLGTSLLGQPQEISVSGPASTGSTPAAGAVTFSGTCMIDMGDGTAPLLAVPFTVTASTGAGGPSTLTLLLATTNLSAATITLGSLTIR